MSYFRTKRDEELYPDGCPGCGAKQPGPHWEDCSMSARNFINALIGAGIAKMEKKRLLEDDRLSIEAD